MIETPRHISNNHMDMVRFNGIEDNEYRKVASAVGLVIRVLVSTRRATEDSRAATVFADRQGSDPAMDVDIATSSQKLQARRDLIDLLYFDEIDARLLSLKSAHKATCQWLLEKDEYRQWLIPERVHDHHGFLWIKGKPGTGKSILMKFLNDHARHTAKAKHGSFVLSFFFNARGEELERSTLGLYRSLLWQLIENFPDIGAVLDLFGTNAYRVLQRSGWQLEPLKQTLANAIEYFNGGRELHLFIDALDECSDDDVADMVSFFEELGERAAGHDLNLRICFSSRYYPTIFVERGFEIKLDEEEEHDLDIVRHIKSQLKLERSKQADALRNQILEKSAGIFLWVALVIPILNKACSSGKVDRFQKCLNDIPSGLHELFEMIVSRDEEDLDDFRLCIQWILFAIRPLKMEEYFFALREADNQAILSSWNSGEISPGDLRQFVLSSSKGFAELTKTRSKKKEPTVQFIHESVRDFFLLKNSDGMRRLWPQLDGKSFASSSHETLKTRCHDEVTRRGQDSIPSLVPFKDSLPKATSEDAKSLRNLVATRLPFLEYATSYLLGHADAAAVDFPQATLLEMYPLDVWGNFYNVFAKYETHRYNCLANLMTILHGYTRIKFQLIHYLLARGMDVHEKNMAGSTPMSLAASDNDESLLDLVLKHGAKVDGKDRLGQTPLSYAAENGGIGIVELLLKHGAEINLKDAYNRTPIFYAAENGEIGIVELLLKQRC